MLHDAHVHIECDALVDEMKLHQIEAIANASNLKEYQDLKKLKKRWNHLFISAGIHPWNTDKMNFEDMKTVLEEALIIGEIGLDDVWCECDVNRQKQIFEQQLAYASQAHKPVILHLKGMEKEALSFLKKYPNHYLVHWYSCNEYLKDYIDLDCYFTIGPSIGIDEAVNQVACQIPLNRMLIETDGINAAAWADGKPKTVKDYSNILIRSIEEIVRIRNIETETLQSQLQNNFHQFLSYTKSSQ